MHLNGPPDLGHFSTLDGVLGYLIPNNGVHKTRKTAGRTVVMRGFPAGKPSS